MALPQIKNLFPQANKAIHHPFAIASSIVTGAAGFAAVMMQNPETTATVLNKIGHTVSSSNCAIGFGLGLGLSVSLNPAINEKVCNMYDVCANTLSEKFKQLAQQTLGRSKISVTPQSPTRNLPVRSPDKDDFSNIPR